MRSQYSESANGWAVWGTNPERIKNFISFLGTSRPILGPTQPPIQLVSGFFSGVGREVGHSPLCSA